MFRVEFIYVARGFLFVCSLAASSVFDSAGCVNQRHQSALVSLV